MVECIACLRYSRMESVDGTLNIFTPPWGSFRGPFYVTSCPIRSAFQPIFDW